MASFEQFANLHQGKTPLLLGNIWDVNSAALYEANGLKAIGTSSSAVAKSMGYDDGERIEFQQLVRLAKRVTETVRIPFTVDIEGGFTRSSEGIVGNIKAMHDVGVVGVNLEDSIDGGGRSQQSATDFQKILSNVSNALSRANVKIFLNIRTDGFLLGLSNALEETLTRIKAYENSGASGIFVPCITREEDIQSVVKATRLPINVMCMPELPGFGELESLGVKRISMGPFLFNKANDQIAGMIKRVIQENNFSSLFK